MKNARETDCIQQRKTGHMAYIQNQFQTNKLIYKGISA